MDMPIHIAAAAVACQATLYVESRSTTPAPSRWRPHLLGLTCLSFAMLSHLFLDAIPHYDVLYGSALKPDFLPRTLWVMFWVGSLSVPVILSFLYYTRDHPLIAVLTLFGGVYPDIEKGAYLHAHLPRSWVLFPFHSCSYSSVGWEAGHKSLVLVLEICLFIGLVGLICWFGQQSVQHSARLYGSFREQLADIGREFSDSRMIAGLRHALNRCSLKQLTLVYSAALLSVSALSDIGCALTLRKALSFYVPAVWIRHLPPRLPYDDKLAHFFMMGLLSLLVNLSLKRSYFSIGKARILKGSLLVGVFIACEEATQLFFSARTFSWGDLAAGYLGVICFQWLLFYLVRHRRLFETKLPRIFSAALYPRHQQS